MDNDEEEILSIDYDKLIEESKELGTMIEQNDILGPKIGELIKVFINVSRVQLDKINQLNQTATDYKNKYDALQEKYNTLKTEYDDLESDYDLVFEANQRKSELLQAIKDNDED